MSKRAIEKYMREPMAEKTAVISIADFNGEFAKLINAPQWLHQVSFDDVDNDVIIDEVVGKPTEKERLAIEEKYHMFSDKQASAIAEFYFAICDKAECIVCQCEHGQSRSAAVAAAILEYRSRRGIKIFSDDRYYPNKVVFRKVLAALQSAAH